MCFLTTNFLYSWKPWMFSEDYRRGVCLDDFGCWIWNDWTNHIYERQIWKVNEKFYNLFMVIFFKIWIRKKNIFWSFVALCLKWLILPYFCTKININPVIFCSTWLSSDSFWSLIPDHQMRKNKSTCWKWKTVIGLLSLSSSYQRYYLDLLPLEVWRS